MTRDNYFIDNIVEGVPYYRVTIKQDIIIMWNKCNIKIKNCSIAAIK